MKKNSTPIYDLLNKISDSMSEIERILSDAGCPYVDMLRKSFMYLVLFKSRFLFDYNLFKKDLNNESN